MSAESAVLAGGRTLASQLVDFAAAGLADPMPEPITTAVRAQVRLAEASKSLTAHKPAPTVGLQTLATSEEPLDIEAAVDDYLEARRARERWETGQQLITDTAANLIHQASLDVVTYNDEIVSALRAGCDRLLELTQSDLEVIAPHADDPKQTHARLISDQEAGDAYRRVVATLAPWNAVRNVHRKVLATVVGDLELVNLEPWLDTPTPQLVWPTVLRDRDEPALTDPRPRPPVDRLAHYAARGATIWTPTATELVNAATTTAAEQPLADTPKVDAPPKHRLAARSGLR